MGRKHKFVNKTHYPDWAIERLTRSIYDDVLAFFATEEGQAEYEAWEREQAELKKKRAAATKVVAASFLSGFSGQTVTVVCLLIGAEINK